MKQILLFIIIGISVGINQQAYSSGGALSLDVQVNNADLIVVGRVGEIVSFKMQTPSKETKYAISSKVTIFPETFVKGHEEGPIIIEFAGGRVGKEVSVPEDSPKFVSGEQVVLFLHRIAGKDSYSVAGMDQGKYSIKDNTVARKNVSVDKFLNEIKSISKP